MNCGKRFGGGQGYSNTCGEHVWGEKSPIGVCEKCRNKLIVKMANMESLNDDEVNFINTLIKKGES